MANQPYLAMTAAEFSACANLPEKIAWMACHFSPYGRGISNIPKHLTPGSILILNDRIEPQGIEPELVAEQLLQTVETLQCDGVLLDFQRPGNKLTRSVAEAVCKVLPCPVAVSSAYAGDLCCSVFLPPPGLRADVEAYLSLWAGRDVWLEVYEQWETVTVTAEDTKIITESTASTPELPHYDTAHHCRYAVEVLPDRAVFTMHRGMDNWKNTSFPITKFIALWQDYGR